MDKELIQAQINVELAQQVLLEKQYQSQKKRGDARLKQLQDLLAKTPAEESVPNSAA